MSKSTIIMPIHNGDTTLKQVFNSLEKQQHKNYIEEIIFINDNSSDNTKFLLDTYSKESSFKNKVINHTKSAGLAANYNEGINLSHSEYFILMHQDIILIDPISFKKILEPLIRNDSIVISYPTLLHPKEVWLKYNFWQKALFSRFVDKKTIMATGKFDGFNKKVLLNEVGLFDEKTYRTAGEDGDILQRIQKLKLEVQNCNVEVVHLHYGDINFSLKKLIKKEAQIAEAQGVKLRKYGISSFKKFLLSFFRQLLIVGLLFPYVRVISIILILIYCFLYTKNVYRYAYKNIRILILPFLNIFLLFVALFSSIKGFIIKKQII